MTTVTKSDRPARPAKKTGKLARENFDSLLSWESACSAVYGGVYSSWPQWARDVFNREKGHVG